MAAHKHGAPEYRLLGAVEVVAGGQPVPLGGVKPQTLLAALLLEHGHIVPVTRLIDVIWPDDPPESARAAIQTYVKTLRQSLARHGIVDVIVTRPPGYLIRINPGELDVQEFHRLVAEARSAAGAQETSDALAAALALWRGPALAGLEASLLAGETVRLNDLRLAAVEERVTADLALGRHGRLVPELAALTGRHPANERLRGQYMIALYRLGRQADALETFRDCRRVLREELGIDPGRELRGIHAAILRADPALLGPPSAQAARAAVPAQLPLVPADFTGRAQQVSDLVAALTPLSAAPVQVITGRAGSGKSALAVRVAHELAPLYPDGQLYAESRGTSASPAEPREVLELFLKALGVEAATIPETIEERAKLFRSLLAGRKVLVLLDDVGSEQQVRPLLPGDRGCAVLITARSRLGGLAGVRRTELDVLDQSEAVELLARIAGAERVAAESDVARGIAELCGGMPLAICIAGARLATRRGWPLALLAHRLADEHRRLDELVIGDLEVRASFELTYRGLGADTRQALRRLSHLGLPEFAAWVVAWAMDIAEPAAEALIERLVDAHLVDFGRIDDLGTPRYRIHDLVRLYGRERAAAEETPELLAEAVTRVLNGWLVLAEKVATDVPSGEIGWPRLDVAVDPVSRALMPRVLKAPQEWFDAEWSALVVGLERAFALGLHAVVRLFVFAQLGPSFLGVNRFGARERIVRAALAAARAAGDRHSEAVVLADLGNLRYLQDRYGESRRYFGDALGAFSELGDVRGQAVALAGLGAACRESGRLVEALHFLDEASQLFTVLDEDIGIGHLRRLAASVRLERGDYDDAWAGLQESLAAYRRAGCRRGEGLTLRTMSLYHRARAELHEAVETAGRAVDIFRELGDPLLEAYSIRAQAKARLRLGACEQALAPLEWVLSVCQDMGDRLGHGITLRTLGELHLAEGRYDDATTCLTAALSVWEGMEVPLWRARAERDLALLHDLRGEPDGAVLRARASKVFHDHGAREFLELNEV
ncbi:winged helix-turn-helix domain-containing protein [Streptosporangiaceae bacterium NEAU-GS5]|nr:winged helix-turn-helix domain-containing protein [Streptosporangiaceae bacterium NEAU-GS5]